MATHRFLLCVWLFLFGLSAVALTGNEHEDTLTVLFAGDVMFDRGVRQVEIPTDTPLRNEGEDFLVVNLETPISDRSTPVNKQVIFRSDTVCADVMQKLGITHVAMANNHSMDHGASGLQETVRHLRRTGIVPVGYGLTNEERTAPTLLVKGDVTVAVFSNITFPVENWIGPSRDGRPNVSNLTTSSLAKVVRAYHKMHPEHHIVLFLHWGTEFHSAPSSRQKMEALTLVHAGAEAIIGHHPHVVQAMEMVSQVPVFYSIGNYLFDYPRPECRQAILAKLQFTSRGLSSFEGIPVNIEDCFPRRENSSNE